MKYRKITWDEIVKLIQDTYKIKNIQLMHYQHSEGDTLNYEQIDYVIGEEST